MNARDKLNILSDLLTKNKSVLRNVISSIQDSRNKFADSYRAGAFYENDFSTVIVDEDGMIIKRQKNDKEVVVLHLAFDDIVDIRTEDNCWFIVSKSHWCWKAKRNLFRICEIIIEN